MILVISHICPPIPVRDFDWAAHFAGQEETGPCGYGRTKMQALEQLLELVDDDDEIRVISNHLYHLEGML